MSNDKQYNGWTNYETWAVALWLGNDEGTQSYVQEMADAAKDAHPIPEPKRPSRPTKAEKTAIKETKVEAAGALAEQLKGYVGEMAPDLGANMFADLLSAALDAVDWFEIAFNALKE